MVLTVAAPTYWPRFGPFGATDAMPRPPHPPGPTVPCQSAMMGRITAQGPALSTPVHSLSLPCPFAVPLCSAPALALAQGGAPRLKCGRGGAVRRFAAVRTAVGGMAQQTPRAPTPRGLARSAPRPHGPTGTSLPHRRAYRMAFLISGACGVQLRSRDGPAAELLADCARRPLQR